MKKMVLGLLFGGFLLPSASHAGWTFLDPEVESSVPKLFSQSGFFSNWSTKTVTPEAVSYEVNSALWSDGAHKERWLILPPGKKVLFNENTDYWDYPTGATFVKIFKHETIPGDSTSLIWWETRVLVNKEDSSHQDIWYGFSYKWSPDGKEAYLIPDDAEDSVLNVPITIFPRGKSKPASIRKWHYPSRYQCLQCHRTDAYEYAHGRSVLGFFTAQINRPSANNATINQITEFFSKGLLVWDNHGATVPSGPELAAMPRWYSITDATQDLNVRARGYIAANCSGCHGDRGIDVGAATGVRLNYDFWQNQPHMAFANRQLTWDFGIEGSALVVPGHPEKSILLHRQKSRASYAVDIRDWEADTSATKPANPPLNYYQIRAQMPPLGSFEEDTAATQILAHWITTFKESSDVSTRSIRKSSSLSRPILQGQNLFIPEGLVGPVTLLGIDGKVYPIHRVVGNQYSSSNVLRPGLYIVQVGANTFAQYVNSAHL